MRRFSAKLILFGEYLLLQGARALAVPVPAFGGEWAWRRGGNAVQSLEAFAASAALAGVPGLDTARFLTELREGLFFKSNIPRGYGLGSSGALCAAVYDRYVSEKTTDPAALKEIFARMESFFHGQSSGIDPLTSYLDRALWIANRTEIHFFDPPPSQAGRPVVFLIDSQTPRRTGPLVEWFLEKKQEPAFAQLLQTQWLPAHEALLDAWQHGNPHTFWPALRQLSEFQLTHLPPMVPGQMRAPWAACLADGRALLKLCGAGGGGFMLGFARSRDAVLEILPDFGPQIKMV